MARTALGVIPLAGSTLAELLNAAIAAPLSKRRDEWLIFLNDGLKRLQEQIGDFDPSKLSDNEQFITTALHATQVALRNHQQEKLMVLRNAVLNTAIGTDLDENVQMMLLNFIDTLTPLHLRVLKYFDAPKQWIKNNHISVPNYSMGSRSQILELSLPELRGQREVASLLVDDLSGRGLLQSDSKSLLVTVSPDGMFGPMTSDFGKKFLRFISDPTGHAP